MMMSQLLEPNMVIANYVYEKLRDMAQQNGATVHRMSDTGIMMYTPDMSLDVKIADAILDDGSNNDIMAKMYWEVNDALNNVMMKKTMTFIHGESLYDVWENAMPHLETAWCNAREMKDKESQAQA